jgi:hypothetical protein
MSPMSPSGRAGAGRADAVHGLQLASGARDHGDATSVDRIGLARLPLVRAVIWSSIGDATSTIYGRIDPSIRVG